MFELLKTDSHTQARLGRLTTAHGVVDTPVYMPVGTQASVKGVMQRDLEIELDAHVILANTYHLFLRPGHELIRKLGGLHRFMSWPRAILTDSGGFQVFSLSDLRKISEDGVLFRSHLDGNAHMFTPESTVDVQFALGSDRGEGRRASHRHRSPECALSSSGIPLYAPHKRRAHGHTLL